jgi:hypothetical protein
MGEYRILLNFLSPLEQEQLTSYIRELEWKDQQEQDFGYLKQEVPDGKLEALKKRSGLVLGSEKLNDCYVIRYPVHSYIPPHIDPTPTGMEHWRINAIIQASESGGIFGLESRSVDLLEGDAIVFQADKMRHRITTIYGGVERYVWSAGILKTTKGQEQ